VRKQQQQWLNARLLCACVECCSHAHCYALGFTGHANRDCTALMLASVNRCTNTGQRWSAGRCGHGVCPPAGHRPAHAVVPTARGRGYEHRRHPHAPGRLRAPAHHPPGFRALLPHRRYAPVLRIQPGILVPGPGASAGLAQECARLRWHGWCAATAATWTMASCRP